MNTKLALFLGLLLAANVCFADLKVGVVNIAAVLEKAPQAEKAKKRLEQEFKPRDNKLVSQQKEIQSLQEKLKKDAAVMGESQRNKVENELQDKIRDAKRSQQEFSEDFNARRNDELGKLQRRIVEAIKSIAKEQEFDLILTDGVIYSSPQMDITSQLQQKLANLPD
ncbi:MAG: OmpH family outer membrane protein [Gammaproteobacteria bacterium]|nr:OmpH family outer membrane protein [Gammaproteobacteria bacterium]